MDNEENKTLSEILEDGRKWQHELAIVLIDLCKRIVEIEKSLKEFTK